MKLISIVCIVLLISAFNMPVMAESNIPVLPDYDNLILSGLETKSITEGIDAVLQNDEGMLSISREIYEAIVNHVCEGQTLLVESRNTMPGENEEVNRLCEDWASTSLVEGLGLKHSTYERIQQTYATDERVNRLLEQQTKWDTPVDLSYTGLPSHSSKWWIQLIVWVVVTTIIIIVAIATNGAGATLEAAWNALQHPLAFLEGVKDKIVETLKAALDKVTGLWESVKGLFGSSSVAEEVAIEITEENLFTAESLKAIANSEYEKFYITKTYRKLETLRDFITDHMGGKVTFLGERDIIFEGVGSGTFFYSNPGVHATLTWRRGSLRYILGATESLYPLSDHPYF